MNVGLSVEIQEDEATRSSGKVQLETEAFWNLNFESFHGEEKF